MRTPASPVTRKDLHAFLQRGVSLVLASRDERMVVELTRCAAAAYGADGRVHVAIPLPEGQRVLANIDNNGVVALSAALPTDYSTVQLKGSDARRAEWPEGVEHATTHRARFVESLRAVGLPDAYAVMLWSEDFVPVVFTPSEVFDQTPGPGAGLALAP